MRLHRSVFRASEPAGPAREDGAQRGADERGANHVGIQSTLAGTADGSERIRSVRGPKGHLISGNLPEFRKDPLGFVTMCAREYGDIVPLRAGPRRGVLLNRPEYIEYVLVTNSSNFTKGYSVRLNRLLLGKGIFTSDGDAWLQQRLLAQPVFRGERIAGYAHFMTAYSEQMLATWEDGQIRDVHDEMTRLTMQIAAKALFDTGVSAQADDAGIAFAAVRETFGVRLNKSLLLPDYVPTPSNLRLRRAVRRLDRIIYGIIEQRRSSGEERGDLLSMLLQARDDDGRRMTDKLVRDELMTFFLAGHDTTSLALTWAFYLLAQHPDVEAKLLDELTSVLGGRTPTVADRPNLVYTEMVVKEAMRLYPPGWGLIRQAIQECSLDGHRIAAGMTVAVSQWVMHRDPRYYDHAEQFIPERWASPAMKERPKFAYFPFGGGRRACLGASFAMMEAVLVLATIAQRFHLSLVLDHPVVLRPAMQLSPARGVKVVLHAR